ncbi:MAG: hypothetical protein JXA54_10195 [Candidatus Heimdallarchaeota archaeon]|nr:hypothetical protein [Candidatus Heimdallarchaeota archaeon]
MTDESEIKIISTHAKSFYNGKFGNPISECQMLYNMTYNLIRKIDLKSSIKKSKKEKKSKDN